MDPGRLCRPSAHYRRRRDMRRSQPLMWMNRRQATRVRSWLSLLRILPPMKTCRAGFSVAMGVLAQTRSDMRGRSLVLPLAAAVTTVCHLPLTFGWLWAPVPRGGIVFDSPLCATLCWMMSPAVGSMMLHPCTGLVSHRACGSGGATRSERCWGCFCLLARRSGICLSDATSAPKALSE